MPNARPKSNTFLFFGHDYFTACESRCSAHYAMIYIFHKVTTSKSVRSRAVKITKFLLLAVKNLLIFTSISCPLTSFVASSSQNSRKSAFLRISIDRSVKGDSLRANSKPRPQKPSELSRWIAAWWVYAVESFFAAASSWKTKSDSKIVGFMPALWWNDLWSQSSENFFFCAFSDHPQAFKAGWENSATAQLSSHRKNGFFSNTKRFNPESLLSRKNVAFHWAKPQIISSCAYRKGVGRLRRSRRQGI